MAGPPVPEPDLFKRFAEAVRHAKTVQPVDVMVGSEPNTIQWGGRPETYTFDAARARCDGSIQPQVEAAVTLIRSWDLDSKMRAWMKTHGWPVTRAWGKPDVEVHKWVSEMGGKTYSLAVTREVAERFNAADVAAALDSQDAKERMGRALDLWLHQGLSGSRLVVEEGKPPSARRQARQRGSG